MKKILFVSFSLLFLLSCRSTKYADIVYGKSVQNKDLKLNIFAPKNSKEKKLPVLFFVHGGNWNSGNKNTYGFFGRNFAKNNVITVIPEYTLSPTSDVNQMTVEIAEAIKWTQQNIEKYSGNPKNLFVTGHSAGAQLVTSAVLNPKFGIDQKSISGIILNDAAGIDMKNYLENYPPTEQDDYLKTWSSNPENWYQASPIYFLTENSPPFLIYVGSKTYPSIKKANENFISKLNQFQPEVKPIIVNKSHIPMILQYFFPWSNRFSETASFIKINSKL